MLQPDTWKQLDRQSGVGGIRKLLAQYRVDLNLPGAPSALELKLYEQQDGRYAAVPSFTLSFVVPKPKGATPARPASKVPGKMSPETEPPAPVTSYASEQEALSQTVQTLIQTARLSKHARWVETPGF